MKRPLLLACLVCLASCQRATVDENGARVVLASSPHRVAATAGISASQGTLPQATATLALSGANDAATRTFTLKWGANSSTFTVSRTEGAANYYPTTVVAWIKEGRGQQRQIVAQWYLAQRQLQLTLVADGGPQAGVVGHLAFHRVVTDELKTKPVVVREVTRIDVEFNRLRCAKALFVEHDGLQRLIVEHHLQVREVGYQRR